MIIELTKDEIVDQSLMVHPDRRNFGADPDIDFGRVKITIGDKPICKNLRVLFELRNEPLPPDLAIFKNYDIWIITHSLGVLQFGGFKKLRQVQYQMEFIDPDGARPAATVIDLLPQTKFKQIIAGKASVNAGINLNGQAGIPVELSQAIAETQMLELDGKVSVAAQGEVVCNLSFSIISTEITTIGIGDYSSTWLFEKTNENPLVGDQLMVQTILVPAGFGKLPFKSRVCATISGPFGLIPVRLESKWEQLECNFN